MKTNNYGELLRAIRELRGLSQATVAERLGVSDVYISLIERGMRVPGIDLQTKIKKEYGVRATCPRCGKEV